MYTYLDTYRKLNERKTRSEPIRLARVCTVQKTEQGVEHASSSEMIKFKFRCFHVENVICYRTRDRAACCDFRT